MQREGVARLEMRIALEELSALCPPCTFFRAAIGSTHAQRLSSWPRTCVSNLGSRAHNSLRPGDDLKPVVKSNFADSLIVSDGGRFTYVRNNRRFSRM